MRITEPAASSLLASRRFLPLFASQALGAVNDNLFKNALVILVVYHAAHGGPELVAAAGGLFMLPYILLSAIAGQVADGYNRARMLVLTKWLELGLMILGAVGFLTGSFWVLFTVLFGLGVQATFVGPLKYGILPNHLADNELVRGNGLIEAGTFGGILAGTIAGGILIGLAHGPLIVAATAILIGVAGLMTAAQIPPADIAEPGLRINWNSIRQSWLMVRGARANRVVWLSILGLSWFWAFGAIFLAEFPVLAQHDFGANNQVITLMLACFVVGIGGGSLLTARLLHGDISARLVPRAALGLSVFTIIFAAVTYNVTPATGWHDVGSLLAAWRGDVALAALMATALCGGLYSVPLYVLIQEFSAASHRSRMVAANNIMNAFFMVIGSAAIAGLAAIHLTAPQILLLAALINLAVAWFVRRLTLDQ
jgi:MFS family permease